MFRDTLARARELADGGRAWRDVAAIAGFHRIQSSPGYDAAADWLAATLSAIPGLEVAREPIAGDGVTRAFGQLQPEGWACDHAHAWLVAGDTRTPLCDFAAEPLSIVQRSAPAGGRFRLVDAARAPDAELRGAAALVGEGTRAALERRVRGAGAAGIVTDFRRLVPPVRDAGTDPDSLAYTSFWWAGDEPRAWGLVVTPGTGAELRRRLAAGEPLELEVDVATRRYAATPPLVSARVPGETDDDVLVVAHLCHPLPGAHDNGSGVAAAIETARVVAALARARGTRARRGVRFLWMPELTGTFAWLAADPARIDRLTAALNLDMVGADQAACGSTFLLEHPPCFAASFAEELLARIRAEALDWVTSFSGPGHYGLVRHAEVPYSGGSDHAVFVDPSVGVPCPLLIHWPDRFYHSSYDTPDRVDPAALALTVRCAATYAAVLADTGPREAEWLAELVARGARRRLLAAADAPDAPRGTARERVRGDAALASLARLGIEPGRIARERAAFVAFADREAPATPAAAAARDARVPVRRERGPLDLLEHQIDGWERLDDAGRAAWRALAAAHPVPALELAWFAADGRRDVDAIARLVALETGGEPGAGVSQFFDGAAAMGRIDWR